MTWRVAKSLDKMREQINTHSPNRNKASDGTIGDARHATAVSDHNPHVRDGNLGVVTALDITHDPAKGVDTWAIADHMRQKRDARVKYVISNKRIFSSTVSPWTWRAYTGSNPHSKHIHVSVNSTKHHFDDTKAWDLGLSSMKPHPDASGPDLDDPKNRPVLRKGPPFDNVEWVKRVQRVLDLALIDGKFGSITEAAVKAFQHKEKIAADGVVGPITWGKLDAIEQIPLPLDYAPPRLLSEPDASGVAPDTENSP